MPSPLKIIFAGTPEFAAVALQALIDSPHEVVAVYTQPDRPAGRGRKLKASPVKQLAEQQHIPVCQPVSLKSPEEQSRLAQWQADVMVVVAYGLLLPQAVLDIPRYGCLNIHASLLPRWRGAAPIQRALLTGDNKTGVTIMQMDAGLDTGDMLLTEEIPITADDTGGSLHDKLAQLGAKAIIEVLEQLQQDRLTPIAQDDSQANYAHKLHKSEAHIDWQQPAEQIERLVRAFNPWPVAFTQVDDKTLRIYQTELVELQATPGQVISADKNGIVIACGHDALRLLRLQPAGAKPMDAAAFINGYADWLPVGCLLKSAD